MGPGRGIVLSTGPTPLAGRLSNVVKAKVDKSGDLLFSSQVELESVQHGVCSRTRVLLMARVA